MTVISIFVTGFKTVLHPAIQTSHELLDGGIDSPLGGGMRGDGGTEEENEDLCPTQ